MARLDSHRSLSKLTAFVKQRSADLSGPIVLISDAAEHPAVSHLSSAFPRLTVLLPKTTERAGLRTVKVDSPEDASLALSEIGAPLAVVDVREASTGERSAWFEWLFFHVAPGGLYVAPKGEEVRSAWLAAATSTVQHRGPAQLKELAASIGDPVPVGNFVAVPKVESHIFKLKEENTNRYLPKREGISNFRTISQIAGGTYSATTTIHEYGGKSLPRSGWEFQESFVRHVRGPVQVLSDGLAVKGNTALPSSFRHARARDVKNDALRSLNQEFAVLRSAVTPRYLEGSYYDLSSTLTGHFGHFVTETVAKLWGWQNAKRSMPDLKALYRTPATGRQPVLERAVFNAYGIADDDMVFVDDDVVVDNYVWSSYLWQNLSNYHFHPAILATWRKLRENLVDRQQKTPERIFISRSDRSSDNRACRNVEDLENRFADAGYSIVYPELLPFGEQATVFGNAKHVAGLAGSAMFNMLFAEQLEKVIVLSHNSYTARNEFLYSMALANELHYFWSRADLQHGKNGFSTQAFHSSWEFDFNQHGEALMKVLGDS
ncbi:glycosyltransferase family 61 protein [Curtobacterium sp. NPDC098951]|uniref:glycosyltransferase family 61 protein n=1 Tax=Curtobacterium sp. NPDC098951 TaxID=3363974 RepID=UPI0038300C01